MDAIVKSVARNLRQLREERGLSLSQLARRSGVAKATLSGLELGQGNPTIETLWALAGALGVPFGDLLADTAPSEVRLVTASEGLRVPGAAGDARLVERLSARGLVEVYEMRLKPGHPYEAAAHAPGVSEHLLVTHGSLRTGPADEPVELAEGDFCRFPGDQPHLYEAVEHDATATVLMSYP